MCKLITLTTDFGTVDSFVAEMKGAILSRNASATLVDLSHGLPAHDIEHASRFLARAVPRFPGGTIHLAVVDPGVGSSRRRMIASLQLGNDTHYVVGPDNGIFSRLDFEKMRAFSIENETLIPGVASRKSFDGREVFAPAAALLSSGTSLEDFGPEISGSLEMFPPDPEPTQDGDIVVGKIICFDRFGNGRSNIEVEALEPGAEVELEGYGQVEVAGCYEDISEGSLAAISNSNCQLELCCKQASAQEIFSLTVGQKIRYSCSAK